MLDFICIDSVDLWGARRKPKKKEMNFFFDSGIRTLNIEIRRQIL